MPPKARVVSNKTGGASAAKTGGTAGGRQQVFDRSACQAVSVTMATSVHTHTACSGYLQKIHSCVWPIWSE